MDLKECIEAHIKVYEYDQDTLAEALKNDYYTLEQIKSRAHYKYFKEFFGPPNPNKDMWGHNATIIVIENEYVSKSYLDDYQGHYVLSHKYYDKYCKRVHFFNYDFKSDGVEKFNEKIFVDEYLKYNLKSKSLLWEKYLGYIVIRPLPRGLIGATVLKAYENDPSRKYKGVREYKINLWGIEQRLNSMVYIEQDAIIGACATSALFSAFHKLSHIFQTKLPHPNKITSSAGTSIQQPNRIFPNDGLDIHQVTKAINETGLVAEVKSPEYTDEAVIENSYAKSYIYAYCRMGIPIILALDMEKNMGIHAVTVNGYKEINNDKLNKKINAKSYRFFGDPQSDLILKAQFIDRLYAHDDQIGPFSRIGFGRKNKIITSWWKKGNISKKLTATLYAIIVPIADVIRINFNDVKTIVNNINYWLQAKFPTNSFYWDVYLDSSNDYKKRLISSNSTDNFELNYKALFSSLPQYIWIAECYYDGEHVLDIILDSTAINKSFFILALTFRSQDFKDILSNSTFGNEDLEFIDKTHLNFFREFFTVEKV